MPGSSSLLPSLGHAASGATGTVISTLATYPLDLVATRLKVQRQLRADGSIRPQDAHDGVLDAFRSIYAKEGGVKGLFSGLSAELGKSAADSFLWFLFYSWFRARRLTSRSRGTTPPPLDLRATEELAIGAAAGVCAKVFTTPVSNVVAQKQTASLLDNNSDPNKDSAPARDLSFHETLDSLIHQHGGVRGLWAGYSASLVLTLNPSLTFFLQEVLKRAVVPRERWEDPGAKVTFLLAAVSKVLATAATYPFQVAKARVQLSVGGLGVGEEQRKEGKEGADGGVVKGTIFATVWRIARAEGAGALYDGMSGELLKGFFSHGTTMLSKDVIHRFIVQLYFAILAALRRYPQFRMRISERMRGAREQVSQRYLQVSSTLVNETRQGGRYVGTHLTPGKGKVVESK